MEEQRGNVVLQRALAATLIVQKKGLPLVQHHVSGLEITVKKIVAGRLQEEIGQPVKIIFESLLVERNRGEAQKIVFEIVEVPVDGLAVEAAARVADGVIQVAPGLHLKAGQLRNDLAVMLHHGGSDGFARPIQGKKIEERGVAEILLNVCAAVQVFFINFGDRQAVAAEMAGKSAERNPFFPSLSPTPPFTPILPGKTQHF